MSCFPSSRECSIERSRPFPYSSNWELCIAIEQSAALKTISSQNIRVRGKHILGKISEYDEIMGRSPDQKI